MAITKIIGRSIVALTIAIAPLASGTFAVTGAAYAKDGNGNSGGGGGNGNGGGHGGGSNSDRGKSNDARSGKTGKAARSDDTPTLKSLFTFGKKDKAVKTEKAAKTVKTKPIAANSNTAGISSLNRNYHAYLNSNDPRMAAISAYAIAYAEFEAENGTDVIPTDPALSDDALRDALASFTKDGVVTDDTLATAKDILGVGPAVGKIDQIRDTLPEPTTTETDTVDE